MTNLIATLSQRIRQGDKLLTAWIGSTDPTNAEILVREGFDTALFDMQHGACDIDIAIRGIAAVALAGKPALVRIPVGDFSTASRALDAGAAAVVAPMINSQAEAIAFAEFMKFPPLGKRSWGPHRALSLSGLDPQAFVKTANDFQLAIAMIETRPALDALEEILGVPGIDGVFVGPADLSIALSGGTELNPESDAVMAALAHVAARAKAHGKFTSAFGLNGSHAKMLHDLGYALASVSTESGLLRAGARAELAVARA
jgi:4-hydroxy-2-oxoheptanedioate aldolase